MLIRQSSRGAYVHREISIIPNVVRNADGSCIVQIGHTKVLCTALVKEQDSSEEREQNEGRVFVEYSVLPTAMQKRISRHHQNHVMHRQISDIIEQSLSTCLDLRALNHQNIIVDCEVVEDDGNTRAAALTGAYVATASALLFFSGSKYFSSYPLLCQVAATSCGILNGQVILDLDRLETEQADVYGFFAFNSEGQLVHVSVKGEKCSFTSTHMEKLLNVASENMYPLFEAQRSILDKGHSHLRAVA